MSDTTAQDGANKSINVDEFKLEDPNFDGKYPNGWKDDDAFNYDYGAHIVKHTLSSDRPRNSNKC
jgi:hypothetical protein